MSDLAFDGKTRMLTLTDSAGQAVGAWPANNRTTLDAEPRFLPDGVYFVHNRIEPQSEPRDLQGSFGLHGIILLKNPSSSGPWGVGNPCWTTGISAGVANAAGRRRVLQYARLHSYYRNCNGRNNGKDEEGSSSSIVCKKQSFTNINSPEALALGVCCSDINHVGVGLFSGANCAATGGRPTKAVGTRIADARKTLNSLGLAPSRFYNQRLGLNRIPNSLVSVRQV